MHYYSPYSRGKSVVTVGALEVARYKTCNSETGCVMIRDNKLSYALVDKPWYSFDIPQTSLSSLVTSVLVTLISYQVAAILFTVTLGIKKRHETRLKNFGLVLLIRYLSSPLAVINSVLRVDWLTRLFYRGDIPRNTRISRDPASVKFRTTAVLLLLVAASPMIDTLLVTLTLSRTKEVTIEDAGFGGVRFGVDDEVRLVETSPYVSLCNLAKFEERSGDVVKVAFKLCETPSLPEEAPENVTGVEISLESQAAVALRVALQGYVVFGSKFAQVTGAKDHDEVLVMADMTNKSVSALLRIAVESLGSLCGEQNILGTLPQKKTDVFRANKVLLGSVGITCEKVTIPKAERQMHVFQIIDSLKEKITFIESHNTLVAPALSNEYIEIKNNVLLERTERNSSMFALIVVATALVLCRIAVSWGLANDIETGLEALIVNYLAHGERHRNNFV